MKMYSYIVAYDLCKPDRDYQSLYEMLRSFPNWGVYHHYSVRF